MKILNSDQAFARKIIRSFGCFTVGDIKTEVGAVKEILKFGPHPNVIRIINEGCLSSGPYFYIDMALCDLSLDEYLSGRRMGSSDSVGPRVPNTDDNDIFVSEDCCPETKVRNCWSIMMHVARGLAFIHGHFQAH